MAGSRARRAACCRAHGARLATPPTQISIMKMVKHTHIVKLYEVLASRTKVRGRPARARVALSRVSLT